MKRTMMAACILSLVACGGSKDDVATDQQRDWESQRQSLVYSFPDQGQLEVPVPSPVVLRFSSPVAETAPAIELREVDGAIVSDVELEWVDGKRGLIITPQNKLKPLTDYVVDVPAIELEKGEASARSIQFTTRGLHEGPRSLVARDTFEVVRTIPDGVNFAVTDFASFRLQFSQPLDPSTVKYGDAGDSTVQLMGPEGLVDAHLLVSGPYITIDPKEDLTPGGDYSLNITGGLTSVYGDNLTGGSLSNPMPYTLTATPVDTTSPTTGERVSMVQDIADTGEISPLTGKPINLVPMASVLLGEETATQASGTLAAELAFVPNFPDQTPLRIKRGSLIEGASIDVLIGGEVPAGFESGKVRMDFLSDATGYLLPNEYSNSDDAPRQVRLWMDVAVSTETPAANGAITQDLLHIELVGTSIVEGGQMVINAVGVVEPDVLGSERAVGLLSFYMKGYEDQDNPPQIVDGLSLEVQSWSPGENLEGFLPSDPVIIRFNKPVAMGDIHDHIAVSENGEQIQFTVYSRGSSLIITPDEGFKRSVQISFGGFNNIERYEYSVQLASGLKDISGGTLGAPQLLEFEMPVEITRAEQYEWGVQGFDFGHLVQHGEAEVVVRSPMITAVYPGYPCALADTPVNLASGMTARCRGGLDVPYSRTHAVNSTGETSHHPHKLPDDILPLGELPANRPIIAVFTKEIDPESVSLGNSFKVETVDEFGGRLSDVSGKVSVEGRRLTFWPAEPWEAGAFYRYVLGSNNDRHSSTALCDGSQAICSVDSLPIQTQLHEVTFTERPGLEMFADPNARMHDVLFQNANAPDGGGIDLVQYFKGGAPTAQVLQVLGAPSVDVNANLMHERNTEDRLDFSHRPFNYVNARPYSVYSVEEQGAQGQPRLAETCNADDLDCYDPDGLLPPWNSAKILPGGLRPAEAGGPTCNLSDPDCTELPYCDVTDPFCKDIIPLVAVGCGFETMREDPTRVLAMNYCPEDKFTYITSDLIAEVGEYSDALGGVPVTIWPGQIMGTSLPMASPVHLSEIMFGFDSGPQVMRMRYAKENPDCVESAQSGETCLRNQPIQAVIYQGSDGEPYISTTLDIYVDAIELERNITDLITFINQTDDPGYVTSDMMSVPATLKLEGKVRFNEDGTMQVEMENAEEVEIALGVKIVMNVGFDVSVPAAWTTLRIPEAGTRVQYISEVIK
ncbi:Ig-like domain-containing protein [Alcanivorax quisquiliarum]|uniref:Ig-like domain-containing protein n=1 Tax=Alcanivorax quisquiliarum TaxID=2933565 RepID=A0ABT0E9P6_9GAMM|nr:Ig-like domain-containing protein [Alcanivorax quisquiliarum]MCK0538576.1 Ig-like domain-containing protein [Alcanivorax quisquiliarum]